MAKQGKMNEPITDQQYEQLGAVLHRMNVEEEYKEKGCGCINEYLARLSQVVRIEKNVSAIRFFRKAKAAMANAN